MERKFSFSVGEYYHIYNRGVDKRKIFLNQKDYQRFSFLLYLCNTRRSVHLKEVLPQDPRGFPSGNIYAHQRGENLVAIGAYCLMPNHFHLLLREIIERGISKFMLKLQTGYSMYFNKKNSRNGALFQGMFKAEAVQEDSYLKYLFAYIHLNPLKLLNSDWRDLELQRSEQTSFENYLQDYSYSSYQDYRIENERRPEFGILSPATFPNYFENSAGHQREIFDWLNYKNPEGNPREN